MDPKQKMKLVSEISDQILSLIDDAEDMDRSDIEGAAMAIAMNAIDKINKLQEAA